MIAHRLDIDFTVRFEGKWHVGSGLTRGMIDRAVLRRGGRPCIPASLFKGNLREACERIASAFGCEVRDPHRSDRRAMEAFVPLTESRFVIDRLFGNAMEGARLFVEELLWPEDFPFHERAAVLNVMQVSIDRATGSARGKRLFSSEVVEGIGAWKGRIEARHRKGEITPYEEGTLPFEYALLVAGLRSLDRIGGDRSIGKGRIEVTIECITYNDCTLSPYDALKSFEETDWKDLWELYREEKARSGGENGFDGVGDHPKIDEGV